MSCMHMGIGSCSNPQRSRTSCSYSMAVMEPQVIYSMTELMPRSMTEHAKAELHQRNVGNAILNVKSSMLLANGTHIGGLNWVSRVPSPIICSGY